MRATLRPVRRALVVIGALAGGCYAESTWTVRVRDPRAVAVVRRDLREDPLTARLSGDDGVALAPGAGDGEALITDGPRRGRVTVSREGGAITLRCARCDEGRAWTLLRASRWTMAATDGRDPLARGDPTVVMWHLDALVDRHAAWAIGLATPRANVAVIRHREAPSRGAGWGLLAGAAAALGFGAYGAAREDLFFTVGGMAAGAGLLATGLWNLLAPPRVTDVTP